MNATTLKALKLSIEHWERLATGKRKRGETADGKFCALCDLFYNEHDDCRALRCAGCPVSEITGHPLCETTPYYHARNISFDHELRSDEFKNAAKLELDFLKSLLPKKGKK